MKRIISKVDYEMHKFGQIDRKLALDLWFKICKDNGIIKKAIEIVENKDGEKCFRAPAICHMILSNPWGIDKKIYDEFIVTLLKHPELNQLSVFADETFLYLILLNGSLGFGDWYLELARMGLMDKAKGNSFDVRKVYYKEIPTTGEKALCYKTQDLDISLTEGEVEAFEKNEAYEVVSEVSYKEVESFVNLVNSLPVLDEGIVLHINQLEQKALNEQRRMNEEAPKL